MSKTTPGPKLRAPLRQCLGHLKAENKTAAREILAALNTSVDNALRPSGLNFLKLGLFLESRGYKVDELQAFPAELRFLAELLAFEVITLQEAQTALRFESRDSVLELFRHPQKISGRVIQELPRITAEWRTTKKEQIGRLIPKAIWYKKQRLSNAAVSSHAVEVPPPARLNKLILDAFGHQVRAIGPLAKIVLSSQFGDDDRAAFREQFPELYALADTLRALLSKEARNLLAVNREGGVEL